MGYGKKRTRSLPLLSVPLIKSDFRDPLPPSFPLPLPSSVLRTKNCLGILKTIQGSAFPKNLLAVKLPPFPRLITARRLFNAKSEFESVAILGHYYFNWYQLEFPTALLRIPMHYHTKDKEGSSGTK